MITYLFTILIFYLLGLQNYKKYKSDKNFPLRITTTIDSLFDERIESKIYDTKSANIWPIENVWRGGSNQRKTSRTTI
jgi:hypothetical protein